MRTFVKTAAIKHERVPDVKLYVRYVQTKNSGLNGLQAKKKLLIEIAPRESLVSNTLRLFLFSLGNEYGIVFSVAEFKQKQLNDTKLFIENDTFDFVYET